MNARTKTMWLSVVAAGLLLANLVDRGSAERLSAALPVVEAIPRDEVSRIEISTAVQTTVLEVAEMEEATVLEDRQWRLVAPIKGDADQVAVRSLLNNFRKDLTLDVKIDEGNLEEYGLDATNGLIVELFCGEVEPELSFTVGFDGPGGTSFIRLSGDEAVYRARVGGRRRYERGPSEWRNRVLMGFESASVARLSVQQKGGETLRVVQAEAASEDGPPRWALEPQPDFVPDQQVLGNLLASLGSMRAGEILGQDFDGGFDPPAAVVEVEDLSGNIYALEVGTKSPEGSMFVRRRGRADVYRAPSPALLAALQPASAFRNRQIFSFQRGDVDTFAWEERGAVRVLLQQDLATSMWNVIQPANTDIDIKLVFFSLNTLADLRSDGGLDDVGADEAGLVPPQAKVVVRLLDGSLQVLELGAAVRDEQNRPGQYVRRAGAQDIHFLRDPILERIRNGFGLN